MPRRWRAVAYLVLAAVVAQSGCRVVSPSLVTKHRTDPVYEMRRVQVGERGGAPTYQWKRVQVDVDQREYQVVDDHPMANAALTVVGLAVLVGLGYGLVYSLQHCESRRCSF